MNIYAAYFLVPSLTLYSALRSLQRKFGQNFDFEIKNDNKK